MKYEVSFPNYTTQKDFSFNSTIKGGSFEFHLRYFSSRWHAWATLPSGEVRSFGIFPNVESWKGCDDFGIAVETSRAAVGYADLADCLIVVEVKS